MIPTFVASYVKDDFKMMWNKLEIERLENSDRDIEFEVVGKEKNDDYRENGLTNGIQLSKGIQFSTDKDSSIEDSDKIK